jgi:hypothetical protein
MTKFLSEARKAAIAIAAALAQAGVALEDGHLSAAEGVAIGLAFLAALGVYSVANKPVGE